MQADAQALDWDALDRPADAPPWAALEALADGIAADPSLWRRAAERYRDQPTVEDEDYSYIAVPTVLAMAGQRLPDEWRRPIGRFLIDQLNQTEEDSDRERELLVEMAGRLGPAILPELWQVVAASTPEDTGWFHLWGVADLALETDDPALRAESAAAMRGVLQRTIDGQIERAAIGVVATLLADLRDDEAKPLVKACLAEAEKSADTFVGRLEANELRHALKRFREPREAPAPQSWSRPLRESVDQEWAAAWEWYHRPAEPAEPVPAIDSGFTRGVRAQKQEPKIGRNEPCPCGSGKKYKKCCGKGG